jgi:hypothetical protein
MAHRTILSWNNLPFLLKTEKSKKNEWLGWGGKSLFNLPWREEARSKVGCILLLNGIGGEWRKDESERTNICVGSVWNYVQFSDNFHVLHLLNDDVRRINKMLEGFIRCNREYK